MSGTFSPVWTSATLGSSHIVWPGFWLAAAPVLVACVPWYLCVYTAGMLEGVFPGASYQAFPGFASYLYLSVGLPVFVFALIGVWVKIVRVKPPYGSST
jgi:hypothetical protein